MMQHGSRAMYNKAECRCVDCQDANRRYFQAYRTKYVQRQNLRHGVRSTYNLGCRCPSCTEANSLYARQYYQHHPERNHKMRRADHVKSNSAGPEAAGTVLR